MAPSALKLNGLSKEVTKGKNTKRNKLIRGANSRLKPTEDDQFRNNGADEIKTSLDEGDKLPSSTPNTMDYPTSVYTEIFEIIEGYIEQTHLEFEEVILQFAICFGEVEVSNIYQNITQRYKNAHDRSRALLKKWYEVTPPSYIRVAFLWQLVEQILPLEATKVHKKIIELVSDYYEKSQFPGKFIFFPNRAKKLAIDTVITCVSYKLCYKLCHKLCYKYILCVSYTRINTSSS